VQEIRIGSAAMAILSRMGRVTMHVRSYDRLSSRHYLLVWLHHHLAYHVDTPDFYASIAANSSGALDI
jgi:hypothetical protein